MMKYSAVRQAIAREVAMRILARRYPGLANKQPSAEARPVFDLTQFQVDAVERATEILTRRRGVVVADSVGLGKTFVALALVEHTLRRGGRAAVTTPAALRRDWIAPLRRLAGELGVCSTSGLERRRAEPEHRASGPEHRGGRRKRGDVLLEGGGTRLAGGKTEPERADTQLEGGRAQPELGGAQPELGGGELEHEGTQLERAGTQLEHPRTQPEGGGTGPDASHTESARPARRSLRARDAPFLGWVSHARLSRSSYPARRLADLDLVVVDEAHAFRSPNTRRYRALADLCRGARVVLLTATPVNNSVMDLYHLVRLFAGDPDFGDVGIPDLREAFRHAASEPGAGSSSPALLPLLSAIVIRRTRPFLREYYRGAQLPKQPTARFRSHKPTKVAADRGVLQMASSRGSRSPHAATPLGRAAAGSVLEFPERAPPNPVRYDYDRIRPGFTNHIAGVLDGLTLAPLRVRAYARSDRNEAVRGWAAEAPVELVRLTLLKRLESSLAAFRASIVRQLRFHEAFLDALAHGRLLSANEHRALQGPDGDGDIAQLILHEIALGPLPQGLAIDRLRSDAAGDASRLRELRSELDAVPRSADPKLVRLIELLEGELGGRKLVVFTEFRDTARFLWRALADRGGVALVDGAGAFLGRRRCGRRAVIDRFAPRANGVAEPTPRERVDLLIATDVLAEGLNLQDASCVASYDLPWNPVRIIQRVGRIDRLGSPHRLIRSYHFLPDRGLDRPLGLLARLRTKLAAIGRTIGAEAAVLEAREAANRDMHALVDRLGAGDPEALDAIERSEAAPFEVDERLRAEYTAARVCTAAHPPTRSEPGGQLPLVLRTQDDVRHPSPSQVGPLAFQEETGIVGAAIRGSPAGQHQVLVAHVTEGRLLLLVGTPGLDSFTVDDTAAAHILLRALEASPADALPLASPAIEQALAAVESMRTSIRAAAAAPAPIRPTAPSARAARLLLRVLAQLPGGPGPALCRRADALLRALSRRHDAGTEAAVRHAVASARVVPVERAAEVYGRAVDLMASLETAFARSTATEASPTSPGDTLPAGVGTEYGQPGGNAEFIAILEVRPP